VRPFTLGTLATLLGVGIAAWVVVATLCMLVGSTGSFARPTRFDAWAFRFDVVLVASIVGAALSAAGVAYQSVLRNPLADPYLLGASTGASLASYLWRLPMVGAALVALSPTLGAVSQQAAAFAGAVAAVSVVFALAGWRGRIDPTVAILVGVIVNSLIASLYLLLNTIFRDLPGSGGAVSFLVGSIQTSLTTSQKLGALAVTIAGAAVLQLLAGSLNATRLSDDEAETLGVRVQRLRWIALGVASLMTAAGVAISGPIAFVGLVCPHLARQLVGQDVRRVLPVATLAGASLLAIADAICRWLGHTDRLGLQLPVGVLTSLLGGPIFLVMLARQVRRERFT
jgi:iron complex transport system permease protein